MRNKSLVGSYRQFNRRTILHLQITFAHSRRSKISNFLKSGSGLASSIDAKSLPFLYFARQYIDMNWSKWAITLHSISHHQIKTNKQLISYKLILNIIIGFSISYPPFDPFYGSIWKVDFARYSKSYIFQPITKTLGTDFVYLWECYYQKRSSLKPKQ